VPGPSLWDHHSLMKRKAGTVKETFKVQKRRKTASRETLGKITGKISPASTTLAKCPGPFSGKRFMTFLYENALQKVSGGTNVVTIQTKPNDMYDYDNTGEVGNKQPLFFDALLTASGPYKQYKVHSWKTTYYFINQTASPVDIFVSPPLNAANECDTVAEADNFPGVSRLRLTAATGSKNYGQLTVTGHVKDVYPSYEGDSSFTGNYNSSPTNAVYQVCVIKASDGTTAADVYVSVKHEAFTELQLVDAIVS